MFKLQRIQDEPILQPIPANTWEGAATFNCGVVYDQGLFQMLYRASDRDFEALKHDYPRQDLKSTSALGYAASEDGINFWRLDRPVFQGQGPQEAWGVEDPRLTKIEDHFYMLYTSFGGRSWDDHRISLARSENLINWERMGVLLDEPNKDAALFEKKIKGRYLLFHRREPHIWVAFSRDLKTWQDHQIIMSPIPGTWESLKIGIAGPPFLIDDGILMLYHAVDQNRVYRLGAALLDPEDPTRVIARQKEPILEPELEWEKHGFVPNVVFSNGHAVLDGRLFVYYGAADRVIGAASVELEDIFFTRPN